jgi:hypothetical protein
MEKTPVYELSKDQIVTLALEIWRMWSSVKSNSPNSDAHHDSVRKLMEVIEEAGCKFVDLTGQAYDAGLAVDILDTEVDRDQPVGALIVKEMVSPVIVWQGSVVHFGQVIVSKGTLDIKHDDWGVR